MKKEPEITEQVIQAKIDRDRVEHALSQLEHALMHAKQPFEEFIVHQVVNASKELFTEENISCGNVNIPKNCGGFHKDEIVVLTSVNPDAYCGCRKALLQERCRMNRVIETIKDVIKELYRIPKTVCIEGCSTPVYTELGTRDY